MQEAERRVRDPNHPWYRRSIRRAETHKAMNALIQGSAARHTKLWMRACWREGIVPLLQMHDALACSVASPELAERVAQLGREAVTLEVPVQVDLKFGRSWAMPNIPGKSFTGPRRPQPRSCQLNRKVAIWGVAVPRASREFRTGELPSGSETEHNLHCAETDVGPIELYICAQCQLDPPDGRNSRDS